MEMDLVLKFGLEINSPIIFQFLYSNHAFWTLLIIILFTIMAASKQLLHDIQDNFDGYKYSENSKVLKNVLKNERLRKNFIEPISVIFIIFAYFFCKF